MHSRSSELLYQKPKFLFIRSSMSLRGMGAWIEMLAIPSVVHLGIIETNFQCNKASPFCRSKLY